MVRPKLVSPDQSLPIRLLLGVYQAAASLILAVVLIVLSAIVLAWATLVESNQGAEAVQFGIYGAWWFSLLMLLLGLNVVCATLIRFPWKKYQTGFLITHAGIVVLLIGCLQSKLTGIEADLPITEGHAYHLAYQNTQHFELRIKPDESDEPGESGESGESSEPQTLRIPFASGPFNWCNYSNDIVRLPSRDSKTFFWFPWQLARRDRGVLYDRDGIRLEVSDYCSDSTMKPMPPLQIRAKGKPPSESPDEDKTPTSGSRWTTLELDVRQVRDPHSSHGLLRLGSLKELPGGERFAYWTAQSRDETEAFRFSRPEGELGALGQLVLFTKGKKHVISVDRLKEKGRIPLGASGIEIELIRHDPRFLSVELAVFHGEEEKPVKMMLLADLPHYNRQDRKHGLFGTYWFDTSKWTADADSEAASMIGPDSPRIDILQGADRKLYFRAWKSPKSGKFGTLPVNGSRVKTFANSDYPVLFYVDDFTPDDGMGGIVKPIPFDHEKHKEKKTTRRARVQLTIDDRTEEFWLEGVGVNPYTASISDTQRKVVQGNGRNASITLRWDRLNVGFDIYLHEFRRMLDPGTSRASHYWSVVDFRELHADEPDDMLHENTPDQPEDESESEPKILAEKVLVILNHPVDFSDPTTGRSYRIYQSSFSGPWKPGHWMFDRLADDSFPRDQIYSSTLSINYDPGRGLKYLGSLLISAGIAVMFYMKAYFFRPRRKVSKLMTSQALLVAIGLMLFSGTARAEEFEPDWTAWESLPTFNNGRMMPLITFARSAVKRITGETNPKLLPDGAELADGEMPSRWAETQKLFPEGQSRKFSADELLFHWMADPERWENVPFLQAEHEKLREDILELPIYSSTGKRLKFVSPAQVENSPRFHRRVSRILEEQRTAQHNGRSDELSPIDQKVVDLDNAFALYRYITFDPANNAIRISFRNVLGKVAEVWQNVAPTLGQIAQESPDGSLAKRFDALSKAMQQLGESFDNDSIALETIDSQVFALVESSRKLAEDLKQQRERLRSNPPDELSPGELKSQRKWIRKLAVQMADLARLSNELHLALYDNPHTLRLVPALNPAALEKGRDTSDQAKPWLSLQTLRFGSPEVLKGYPPEMVDDVRRTFDEAYAILSESESVDRAEQFNGVLDRFAQSVRRLGEAIEPARKSLPLREIDETLIEATAYPPVGSTRTEVHYYRFNPFLWSWVATFIAMLLLAAAFGLIRKPMFWAGLIMLAVAQGFTTYGLALRVLITNWAPVTNMFETVVFVALVTGLMGIWFALLPLIWPGLSTAWRINAVPLTPEATPLRPEAVALGYGKPFWTASGIVFSVARLALATWIVYLLTMVDYGAGNGYTVISLLPRKDVGASFPTLGNIGVWAVGMSMLLLTVWFVPRAVFALVVSLFTIPATWKSQGLSKPLDTSLARKQIVLAAAGVGLLASVIAYRLPLSGKDIGPLMPILRDNVWLTLHVLTITASYGAGGLAWGLGLIALGYYLFGKYRDPNVPSLETLPPGHRPAPGDVVPSSQRARRPPGPCAALSHYIYKSTQVAVLFLVIGTILGGLWADVSWGRFWGWDPKEVWALISLLIYLVVLHGRYAGFLGNFGMTVGAIVGVSSILMAWYGVNYWLGSGQHTYGGDSGGIGYVAAFVFLNWIFVGIAAMRYLIEMSAPPLASN